MPVANVGSRFLSRALITRALTYIVQRPPCPFGLQRGIDAKVGTLESSQHEGAAGQQAGLLKIRKQDRHHDRPIAGSSLAHPTS